MRTRLVCFAACIGLFSTTASFAQSANPDQSTAVAAERKGVGPLFGVMAGGLVPFSGLTPGFQVGLEAGLVLPVLHRGLAVAVDLDYAQAWDSGTTTDPRVLANGGTYSWNLTQEFLTVMPMVLYRLTTVSKTLTPFVGVGPRIYFMRSTTSGSAGGSTIDDTTEVSTQIGFGIPLGLEIKLGPGGLLAELLGQWGPYTHTATGDTHTGAIGLSVGYRLAM
jgi:hypothetical protein